MKITKSQLKQFIGEAVKQKLEEDTQSAVALERAFQNAAAELASSLQDNPAINFDQLNQAAGNGGLQAVLFKAMQNAVANIQTQTPQKKTNWGTPRKE